MNVCISMVCNCSSLELYVCLYVCMYVGELTDVLLVLTTDGAVQAFSSNAQIAVGTEVVCKNVIVHIQHVYISINLLSLCVPNSYTYIQYLWITYYMYSFPLAWVQSVALPERMCMAGRKVHTCLAAVCLS